MEGLLESLPNFQAGFQFTSTLLFFTRKGIWAHAFVEQGQGIGYRINVHARSCCEAIPNPPHSFTETKDFKVKEHTWVFLLSEYTSILALVAWSINARL